MVAIRHGVSALIVGSLLVECTGSPIASQPASQPAAASSRESTSSSGPLETAPPTRLLAGTAMTRCTISGEVPVVAQAEALCGILEVPENRSAPDGRTVALRVAVIPARATAAEPDALFALPGGSGEAATSFYAWFPSVFRAVLATRDVVLVDQRGTGESGAASLPALPDTSGRSAGEAEALKREWADDALASFDGDPRFYTSAVAADDLDDVRAALGYETLDLYGASYGGTVAQYYLRQHGEHVRVAVLDGATPLDVPVLERRAASSQAALDLLFGRCASDRACQAAFPDVRAEWEALVARLAEPIVTDVVDPETGEHAVLSLVDAGGSVHQALREGSLAARLPRAFHLAHTGDLEEGAALVPAAPERGTTLLMSDEILCSEAWARFEPANVERAGAGSYLLAREQVQAEEQAAVCRVLPKGIIPPHDGAPVRTDLPILWVTADGDPQDPPANLAAVPSQQPNSRILVLPAQQHVVGHLACMPSVIASFLEQGSASGLDTACAERADAFLPPFQLP